MSYDFNRLEPLIRQILSEPDTDLSTISAKRVRRRLVERDETLTAEFLLENKEEVDRIITDVYQSIQAQQQGAEGDSSASGSRKRRGSDDDDEEVGQDNEGEDSVGAPPPKKARKTAKNGQELKDAKLARQLSNEINGSSRRSSGKARANGTSKGRKKKSAATVESGSDGGDDDEPKKKKSSGGARGGFAKEYMLSQPLAAVLNVEQLSRPQVVKHLWDYIKGNELQNPDNKREIICDEKLKAVFKVEKVDIFRMNKFLGQHLHKIEA